MLPGARGTAARVGVERRGGARRACRRVVRWAAGALPVLLAGCATLRPAPARAVQVWLTTGDQAKLLSREADLAFAAGGVPTRDTPNGDTVRVDVDTAARYQTIVGFGAAFTDASVQLIQRLPTRAREALLGELFGRAGNGIGLSFMRVTMAASDFSTHHYSYDDLPPGVVDTALARFSIDADRAERLPVITQALRINPALTLVASPWSPPAWMKTSNRLITGTLRPEAYGAFARYFVKFVQAYATEGVPIRAVTLQNEPHFEPKDYPGMRLEPPARARLIAGYVGPAFAAAGLRTEIWDWDHNWDEPESPLAVLADPAARRYVRGVAWHCYAGDVAAQSRVRAAFPDVPAYFTECSGGEWQPGFAGPLTSQAATLVVGATRNWARGVALWNLALDERHGPHLGGCTNCRGVVTIHSATGAVTRNAEYYALAHASRFVRPGAVRLGTTVGGGEALGNTVLGVGALGDTASRRRAAARTAVTGVAFRNADDGSTALVLVNPAAAARPVAVRAAGRAFRYTVPAAAVVTFVWRR